MGRRRGLVRGARAAPGALLDHRLRVERPEIGAARIRLHRTGRGQKVEVSLYETSLAMLANVAANYLIAGRDGGRFGNGHPSIVPYTTYRTADQMIALGVGNDAQFARFAAALGRPEWLKDPCFASNRDRVVNRDRVDRAIEDALASDTADAWLAKLKAAGIPCG